MAAPAYVSGSTKIVTSADSLTITCPASVVAGNLLLLVLIAGGNDVDTPSGWTATGFTFNTDGVAEIFWKVATSSEPSTYTVSFSAEVNCSAVILQFSGANNASPFDGNSFRKTFETTAEWNSITTADSTETLVLVVGGPGSNTTVSTPATTTARNSSDVTGFIAAFTAPHASAGATPTYTATLSKTSEGTGKTVVVALEGRVLAKATFVGSGVFAAGPFHAKATFVGSGVFASAGGIHATAPFTGSGILSANGVAYALSHTGMPGISLQIALTGTCWSGSDWVTIGPLCRQFSVTRGRQHQLQRVEPGQLTMTLFNRDGRFNPWSKNTPYYNQLPATDSNPTTGDGTWTTTNATLARTETETRYGSYSWKLTASAAGTMTATTDSATTCVPGRTYQGLVYVRAKTTSRSVKVSLVWKNSSGTVLSTTTGTAANDSDTTFTTQWLVRGVAPSGAVKKDVRVTVTSAAESEVHYFACAGVFDVTYTTGLAAVGQGWCVGQESPLWPGQPIRCLATWHGTQYSVFGGVVKSWVPKYGTVAGDIVVTANDYMHLMANIPVPTSWYTAIISESGPTLFWKLNTSKVLDSSGNGHTGTASTTFLTFNGTPLVPHTTLFSAAFHLERETTTGTITASVTQPTAWSVELIVRFTPTLETSDMKVNVFSWGSGATRINLLVTLVTSANSLCVTKGTATPTPFLSPAKEIATDAACHVVVTYAPTGTTQLFVNHLNSRTQTLALSVRDPTFQLGGSSSVDLSGQLYIQDVSIYDHVLSDTEIKDHWIAWTKGAVAQQSGTQIKTMLLATGVPSSILGTIAAGTILCKPPLVTKGETQLLSVLQTTDNTEQGLLFCASTGKVRFLSREDVGTLTTPRAIIADDMTASHYNPFVSPVPSRDDTTLFNYVAVGTQGTDATDPTETDGTPEIAKTTTSAAKYGRRMLTGFTGMYFATKDTALRLAELLVARLATPVTRVRAVQLSSVSGAGENLPIMLGFELLTLVEVWWQPLDGSDTPFIQTAGIEQIKHTVTKTKWVTTWVLAIPIP